MTLVRVESFSISADGYGAGADQALDNPMGTGGMALHGWALKTRTFRRRFGQKGGSTGVDDAQAIRGFDNIGAWILGRNMFGPVRGPWPDETWKGWWGDVPPYHCDVFVLTHHVRPPLEMAGGTTFHFVNNTVEAVVDLARKSANGRDIRLGGGVATLRAALQAQLVDRMHLAVSPVVLGRGESVFAGLDLPTLGYRVAESKSTADAMHLIFDRKGTTA
jgi:dihydrofolate reductase